MEGPSFIILETEADLAGMAADHAAPGRELLPLSAGLRAALARRGVAALDTRPFFGPEDHAACLRRVHQMHAWLAQRFRFRDGSGVEAAYGDTLLWHARFFLNYLLWTATVLANACLANAGAEVAAVVSNPFPRSARLREDEGYAGLLAQRWCQAHGNEFRQLGHLEAARQTARIPYQGGRGPLWGLARRLYLWRLRSRLGRHPGLVANQGHRLHLIAAEIGRELAGLSWARLGDWLPPASGRDALRRSLTPSPGSQAPIVEEINLALLASRPAETRELAVAVEKLAAQVESNPEIFNHQGVGLADLLAAKLRLGIGPRLQSLLAQAEAMKALLDGLPPRLVLASRSREELAALGELCHSRRLPGLMISHGSFTPMKDDLERMAWEFHGKGLFYGAFACSAMQSPPAARHASQLDTDTKFFPTGPLVWGGRLQPGSRQRVRSELFGPGAEHLKVVIHAGTPKPREYMHFHIYETVDEYLAALNELVEATGRLADTRLIIRFRPAPGLSTEDLKALVPMPGHVALSSEGGFLDMLAAGDLLVSFSSTTIEEALQNRMPVMLYGSASDYRHLPAVNLPDRTVTAPRAVYSCREAADLAPALEQALALGHGEPPPEEAFAPFVYGPDKVLSPGAAVLACRNAVSGP